MSTNPQNPFQADEEPERANAESGLREPWDRGMEQRPDQGPPGRPYGGGADVPDEPEQLPGEWKGYEEMPEWQYRASGPR